MNKGTLIFNLFDKIGLHGLHDFNAYEGVGLLDIVYKWFFRFFDVFLGFIAIGGGIVLSFLLGAFVLVIIGRKLFTTAERLINRW